MEWLCTYRRDGSEASGEEADLPAGAMIVKEMHSAAVDNLAYRPDTATGQAFGKLWVDADLEHDGVSWTVMIKGAETADGWYWGDFSQASSADAATYNPPIDDRAAFAAEVDPQTGFPIVLDGDGKPFPPPPGDHWYPTYWNYEVPDVVFPNYGAGYYCIYCHGSAVSQSTFSSLANVLGHEIEYDYLREIPPSPGPTPIQQHGRSALLLTKLRPAAAAHGRAPFPDYRPLNAEAFEAAYPQFQGLDYDRVWPHRLPAQTWDHAAAAADGSEEFLTSDQCLACHGAGGYGQRLPNMVVVKDTPDDQQLNLTPFAEWSASPMGLGGRDPIFYAMLESELNLAEREGGDLSENLECIQNTCLHCHGNMGQRQWALDTRGSGDDPCADFEPATDPTVPDGGTWTPEERRKAGYGGQPFLRDFMATWPGDDPQQGRYGGLGRDGISCTTCHRMSAEDLGQSGKTFTGNFRTGPTNKLFGPFDDNVKTEPMELSLGIEPLFGEQLTKSEMCGSCHSIYLPVFSSTLWRSVAEPTPTVRRRTIPTTGGRGRWG
jgi:mono/diheme cytochrome c family protein